jgi:hypothetical protein
MEMDSRKMARRFASVFSMGALVTLLNDAFGEHHKSTAGLLAKP